MKQEEINPEAIYIHPKLKWIGPKTGAWWLRDFATRNDCVFPTWWSGGWDELEEYKESECSGVAK